MRYFFCSLSIALSADAYANNAHSKAQSFDQYVADEKENAEVLRQTPLMSGKGTVTEAIHTADYSYLEVKTNEEKLWLATTKNNLKPADEVIFKYDTAIENFESKTLKRHFAKIYFVDSVTLALQPDESDKKVIEDEQHLAAFIKDKNKYQGKLVKIIGRVSKVNTKILGKNWIHVTDKSLKQLGQDLTITSQTRVEVGQLISAEGILAVNKDFGSGYYFPVIIEDANVKTLKNESLR